MLHPSYEDSKEDEEDEEVVIISDEDEKTDDNNSEGDESSDPKGYVTNSEMDPQDKINALVNRTREHAFSSIWSFRCMLPNSNGGLSII